MKKVLITGCSGFLASHLIKRLIKKYDIYGFTEIKDFKTNDFDYRVIDIRDDEKVKEYIREVKPDLTFHFAAITNVGFSWKNKKLTYEVNIIGSSNLFEALSEYSPHSRVLIMSSAELYGYRGNKPIGTCEKIDVKNPYSLSKYSMEMISDLYNERNDLNIVKIRSFNFTGPGQDSKFVASDFAKQIAMIERGYSEPVIHVGNLDVRRDFSDVRDIVEYLIKISDEGKAGEIFNLCSGEAYSIRFILETLLSFSNKQIEVIVDKSRLRPADIPVLFGDYNELRRRLRIDKKYKIEETLFDLLEFWRKRV